MERRVPRIEMKLGAVIRAARSLRGWTQRDAAVHCEVPIHVFHDAENGIFRPGAADRVQRLALHLPEVAAYLAANPDPPGADFHGVAMG